MLFRRLISRFKGLLANALASVLRKGYLNTETPIEVQLRSMPAHYLRLDDGFSTKISLAGISGGVDFWEKEVTPPGYSGGGPNDTTTMRNIALRTKAPKKLKTMTEMTVKVAYATGINTSAYAIVNVNTLVTVTYPDTSTLQFWGYLDEFKPDAIKEGEQPTATITIQCTNQDNSAPPVEQAPIYTAS